MSRDMSCIVLAGGNSSRLDNNKIFTTIGNRTLLQRVACVVSSFSSDIIIVTSKGQSFSDLTGHLRLRIVNDIYPGKGPLGGLYTGLVASNSFYNLVVASDMPFLNQTLLSYMMQVAPGFDAVVPRLGNMFEPLHAVYSNSCRVPLEWLIKQGNLKISDLFPVIRVRYVEAKEIDRFDPKHLSLFNVNTEADLAEARVLANRDMSDIK